MSMASYVQTSATKQLQSYNVIYRMASKFSNLFYMASKIKKTSRSLGKYKINSLVHFFINVLHVLPITVVVVVVIVVVVVCVCVIIKDVQLKLCYKGHKLMAVTSRMFIILLHKCK